MNLRKMAIRTGMAGAMLVAGTAAALAADARATTSLNVRSGPGTQYAVVDVLAPGERVDVLGCRGSWCEIEHPGPDGWVSANYLTRDDFYDDGPSVIVRPPRYAPYPGPYYWNYPYRRPYANFCIGSPNARFCIGN